MKKAIENAFLLVTGLVMMNYAYNKVENDQGPVEPLYHNITGIVKQKMDLPSSNLKLVEIVEPEGLFPSRNFTLRNFNLESYKGLKDLKLEKGDTLDLRVQQNYIIGREIIYTPKLDLKVRYTESQ